MKDDSENSWSVFYRDGISFMNTAEKSLARPDVFTPEIIYNLASMAIEKLIMAVSLKQGSLPYIHTMSSMGNHAKEILSLDDADIHDMERMDSMQMMCSNDELFHSSITAGDIPFILSIARRILEKTELFLADEVVTRG